VKTDPQFRFDPKRAPRLDDAMRHILTLALFAFACPAQGQEALNLLQGKFGSASDAAASCATNPHDLAIIDDRPHLARIWEKPYQGSAGAPRLREVYDLESAHGTSLTLHEEGTYRADSDGQVGGLWVMQFTHSPEGYCWRRPDWPITRCEDQHLRCEAPIS
jgi:hypothetical protein